MRRSTASIECGFEGLHQSRARRKQPVNERSLFFACAPRQEQEQLNDRLFSEDIDGTP